MCPTLTVGSIFTRVRSTFCSFVQQLELRKFKILEPQKRVQNENKNKKDIQNLENTLGSPFFSTLCDFFNCFGFHQRVSLQLFRYFATQWMSKNPIVSPFTYFGAVTLFKNLLQKFFWEFFNVPKSSPCKRFTSFTSIEFNVNVLHFHSKHELVMKTLRVKYFS